MLITVRVDPYELQRAIVTEPSEEDFSMQNEWCTEVQHSYNGHLLDQVAIEGPIIPPDHWYRNLMATEEGEKEEKEHSTTDSNSGGRDGAVSGASADRSR